MDCVFSTEALVYPQSDGTVCDENHGGRAKADGFASGFGAATMVTATFGFVAGFSCAEEDDGESGASGVNNQVGCDANVYPTVLS